MPTGPESDFESNHDRPRSPSWVGGKNMRDEIAELVHPVIVYGLTLRQRLAQGQRPPLETEQAVLKGMLQTEAEAQRLTEFGGESRLEAPRITSGGSPGREGPRFLGVRYALVCWLDELFILDSPWESDWNERKLEVALYGTNDRAWRFWEQAQQMETRPTTDGLEVFFLCVMLGFRGEWRSDPVRLHDWVSAARTRIARNQGQDWAAPPSRDAPTYVPPLRGRDVMRKTIMTGGVLLLLLVPVLTFMLVAHLGN